MSIVRAPHVNPDGTIVIQGWRALCPKCLDLGRITSYYSAGNDLEKHRKVCTGTLPPCTPKEKMTL